MSDFEVVAGGLSIVFIGMIAIVGLLFLISGVIRLFSKRKEPQQSEAGAGGAPAGRAEEAALPEESGASEEELAAVIAAAVAAYRGEGVPSPRFRVTSFKRIGPRGGQR